jgi:hypothetical protein
VILIASLSCQNLKGFNFMLNNHLVLLSMVILMQVLLSICFEIGTLSMIFLPYSFSESIKLCVTFLHFKYAHKTSLEQRATCLVLPFSSKKVVSVNIHTFQHKHSFTF